MYLCGEGVESTCKKIKQENIPIKQEEDKCEVKMDVRMQTSTNAEEMFKEISDMVIGIAHKTGCNYKCKETDGAKPVKTSTQIISQVEEVCKEKNIKSTIMPSWAGHDIAHLSIMEKILLFIKSTGGSHKPSENTTKQDLEKGIEALEGSIEKDIMYVHEMSEEIDYLKDNSIENIARAKGKKEKAVIRNALFDIATARNMGISIPEILRRKNKRENFTR